MDISWPGLIIGTLMTAACIFAFRKRDAISGFASSQPEFFLGRRSRRRWTRARSV